VPNSGDPLCQSSEVFKYASVTECQNNEKFFEGEELSYLYKKPILDDTHKMVNDYANQWTIDPDYIKANFNKSYYQQICEVENPDGSIDVELILYFKVQSYFYLGLAISGIVLIFCAGYLIFTVVKKRGANIIK